MWGEVVPVKQALVLDKLTAGKLKFNKEFYQAELMKSNSDGAKLK
jgi:hypothetical protein